MPTFLTTLTEILLYVAPGMLVVYAVKPMSEPLRNLIASSHQSPSAFALLFVWLVVGGVIARGCGVIVIRVLIFIRKLFLADERQIAWRNLFFLTGKDSIRLATSKAVFRQDIEKIKYYASTQHSMEAFAATFVALAFLGTIRRWFSCNDPDSEKSLAILWLILGGLMLIATWIALDVFLRRGRAFQEIANEQSGKKILPP